MTSPTAVGAVPFVQLTFRLARLALDREAFAQRTLCLPPGLATAVEPTVATAAIPKIAAIIPIQAPRFNMADPWVAPSSTSEA